MYKIILITDFIEGSEGTLFKYGQQMKLHPLKKPA